mmetsp:Transcript_42317/g.100525  ORF Transcript_42317/g.100525 Transcript_42317/m.100525 type:complete len:203 (+) Transcript_42317:998-1606(+)
MHDREHVPAGRRWVPCKGARRGGVAGGRTALRTDPVSLCLRDGIHPRPGAANAARRIERGAEEELDRAAHDAPLLLPRLQTPRGGGVSGGAETQGGLRAGHPPPQQPRIIRWCQRTGADRRAAGGGRGGEAHRKVTRGDFRGGALRIPRRLLSARGPRPPRRSLPRGSGRRGGEGAAPRLHPGARAPLRPCVAPALRRDVRE